MTTLLDGLKLETLTVPCSRCAHTDSNSIPGLYIVLLKFETLTVLPVISDSTIARLPLCFLSSSVAILSQKVIGRGWQGLDRDW